MFTYTNNDLENLLRIYHMNESIVDVQELLRYRYEENNPTSKEVRVIIRIVLSNHMSVVMKFKNEVDVTLDSLESQCQFAQALRMNRIATPKYFNYGQGYVIRTIVNGYDVFVTLEEYVENVLKQVDYDKAFQMGKLLAKTHCISKTNELHISYPVLFNPFEENDLFFIDEFKAIKDSLNKENLNIFHEIISLYEAYMTRLNFLKFEPKYAVQGDFSQENLYLTEDGDLGVIDFNRAGDNYLFCDSIMQGVFISRLMDYEEETKEETILYSFLNGYHSVRPFLEKEKEAFPYLYAIITAFWGMDILFDEDSLVELSKRKNNDQEMKERLKKIHHNLVHLKEMILSI